MHKTFENQNSPIFKNIFGSDWERLPLVMHKHYANHPYSLDQSTAEGTLDLMCKWYVRPFFWLLGTVPPYTEKNVPVTVHFISEKNSEAFCVNRIFHFQNRCPFHFHSRMYPQKKNLVLEVMNYGICWNAHYSWNGKKVLLRHQNYSLRLLGINIILPITWLIGRTDAEESPIDDDTFEMCATITHPLLGKMYEYKGSFKMVTKI